MTATSGFRAYPPKAAVFRNVFTGAVIATPVLDLSSVRGPQGYADRSGTGANGVPIGAPANARGVYDEAIKFGGVRDTLNCGSNAPLDVAGNISVFCWVNEAVASALSVLLAKTNGVSGWYLALNGLSRPQIYFYNGGVSVGGGAGIVIAQGRFTHTGFTVLGTVARLFVDGLEWARGVVAMSDDGASSLYIGSGNAGGNWENGLIELPQVYNGALSPEQIYRNHLQAKDVPIYYDTFESYAVTPVAKTAGSMCGPFRVVSGTDSITVDASGQHWLTSTTVGHLKGKWPENNAYGMWEFDFWKTAGANYILLAFICSVDGARTAATQNGYIFSVESNESVTIGRLDNGVVPLFVMSSAGGYVALDTKYRVRIIRRVGGSFAMYIKGGAYLDFVLVDTSGGAGTNPAVSNTYTAGEYSAVQFDGVGDKFSAITRTRTCERPASFPWEFSTGTYAGVVSGSTVWMRCLTAGVTYLPKDLDWQTCTFRLYKGADANVTDVLFVASEIGGTTFANQNGYVLRLAADESVQLIRMSGGVETPILSTAASYISITTEYEFKITHNGTTNAYDFFIRGGAYANWTSMGLAATLGIHTSSNYHITDLDASDRTTAPQFYLEVR